MLDGKSHEIGLGSASAVSLAKARKMAQTYRERVVADKVDVAAEKKAEKTERRERAKAAKTPPTTT
jgi:hypothetical protein